MSAAVFNNRYMVDVLLDLDARRTSDATTRQVAASTRIGDSLVRPVMLRLQTAGVLVRMPRLGGPRGTQYFELQRSATWDNLVVLARGLAGTGVGPEATAGRGSADPGGS